MSMLIDQPRFEEQNFWLPPGNTLEDIARLAKIPEEHWDKIGFLVNGSICEDWSYRTNQDDYIRVAVRPQGGGGGGKNIFSMIASIAISFIAPYAAVGLGGSAAGFISAQGVVGLTTFGKVLAFGIGAVANMALNALISPSVSANTASFGGQARESQTYGISTPNNVARPYETVPCLYGSWRMAPNLVTTPNIHQSGKTSRITALYDFGYGHVELGDIRIGGQPIGTILDSSQQRMEIHTNSLGTSLKWVTGKTSFDQLALGLGQGTWITVQTKPECNSAILDISFPRGLVSYNTQNGNRQNRTISIGVQWRPVGGSWSWVSRANFAGATFSAATVWTSLGYSRGNASIAVGQYSNWNGDWDNSVYIARIRINGQNYFKVISSREWSDIYSARANVNFSAFGGTYRNAGGRVESYTDRDYNNVNIRWYGIQLQRLDPTDRVNITNATAEPFTVSVQQDFPTAGHYEFRVYRYSAVSTTTTAVDDTDITFIRSFQKGSPINLKKRHTLLELSIIATDKVNGVITDLTAHATRYIRDIDDNGFLGLIPTQNPALIALDILAGTANNRPLHDSQINFREWNRLKGICDQIITTTVNGKTYNNPRYTFNGVIDTEYTVKEIVNDVLANARSQIILDTTGKYSVLHDEAKTPRQLFTPSNYANFVGEMNYYEKPHAFKVSYIEPAKGYTPVEFYAYYSGYNESNTEKIEELRTFGITHYAEAHRYAWFMMAQTEYRAESFSIEVQAENLVIQRGDMVLVTSDVAKAGGMSARVVDIAGGILTLDQQFSLLTNSGYTVRTRTGVIKTGAIITQPDTNQIEIAADPDIQIDDLIVVGETDKITNKYLVNRIEPGADLKATLSLIPYDERVYSVDSNQIPDWDPDINGGDLIEGTNLEVVDVKVDQTVYHVNRMPFNQLYISWKTNGSVGTLDHYNIYFVPDATGEKELIANQNGQSYTWNIDLLERADIAGKQGTFIIEPVNKLGSIGQTGELVEVIDKDDIPPHAVEGFGVNVQDMQVNIFWNLHDTSGDISHYEVRYSPNATGGDWLESQLIGIFNYDVNRTTVGARTGMYMIRAFDTSLNAGPVSINRTTIEYLPSIDLLLSVDDAQTNWSGNYVYTEKTSDNSIVLAKDNTGEIAELGFYYYQDTVDLNFIQEVRLSSKLQSTIINFSNVMSTWIPLASQVPLAAGGLTTAELASAGNVWAEYRAIDTPKIVMKDWTPLNNANAKPIAGAIADNWGPWRPFEVIDIQARVIQFRIRMESYVGNITPKVFDGLIEIDLAERFWHINDVQCPDTGLPVRIVYDPPFVDKPTIAVTVENTAEAVSYEISNHDRKGFEIILVDSDSNRVAGQFDVLACGWGKERLTSI